MNRYFGVHVLDGEWHALLPRYLILSDRVEGKRILDIGCGTGIGSSLLLELGADQVDGVDYQPGVLDLANIKHAKESLNFHMMLWEDLEFPDDQFDMVVCLDPTTPVTDPSLLEEVSRVLTDDGEYVCAIERRTIEGFESLLPRYGYSAPAENVELGERDEQAPQIGELTNYFDTLVRVLQRPEYNYVFEPEQAADSSDGAAAGPVDYTLCTEDSHIAGVELIYCGPEEMPEPESTSIRLPYYRLAERLSTVIRDLNVRQGPGAGEAPLGGPVETAGEAGTSPEPRSQSETTTSWNEDSTTNVQERPDRSDDGEPSEGVERELDRLTNAYRQLQQNFEQLRDQTQAAMVAQERSMEQLVQMFRTWGEDQDVEWGDELDEGASPHAETDIYEASRIQEAVEAHEAEESTRDEIEAEVEELREEREELRREMEEREEDIEQLREELDALRGEGADEDSEPEAEASSDEQPDTSEDEDSEDAEESSSDGDREGDDTEDDSDD